MLQAKVHRLEHILHLKDLRLQDIQQRNAAEEVSRSRAIRTNYNA